MKRVVSLLFAAAVLAGYGLRAQDFKKQVIYQIITDRFYDGDPSNNDPPQSKGMYDPTKSNWQAYWGGDLAGIQAKLPYLKSMGVTALWISPSVDNINVPMMGPDGKPVPYLFAPYHGYINRDFKRVEEHFGSSKNDWKAFDALTAAAHRDGIKIVLDFSPNDSNLINTAEHGALRDNGKPLATYDHDTEGMFHHEGTLTDINDAYQLQYYNVFGLADLNEDNPVIDRYIKDSIHQFQDHGVDAVRLDAVRHINWGWSYSFANSLFSYKPSFMFAEWFMGGTNDKFYSDAYKFANKSGMSLLDYPLAIAVRDVFAYDKSFSSIPKTLETEDRDFERPNDLATFVDNHDIPRLLTVNHNRHRIDEATAFVLTSRGIPIIYYGDEQYLHDDIDGGRDPYTRVWMSSYDTNTVGFRLVKKLAGLRQTNDALAYGTMKSLWVTPDVYVFERHFANDTVLVAINKNEKAAASIPQLQIQLKPGSYADYLDGLMDGSGIHVGGNSGKSDTGRVDSFTIAPHSVSVWQSTNISTSPEIGSVGPAIGQPGMLITIAGTDFGTAMGSVRWRNSAATIHSWTNNQVTAAVPTVSNGACEIRLRTANGQEAPTAPFTVLQAKLVSVTFTVENVPPGASALYLTGNTVEIGGWKTDRHVAPGPFLCPRPPACFLDISVPAGKQIEFKLFQVAKDGSIQREAGKNHVVDVPKSGTGAVSVKWQE